MITTKAIVFLIAASFLVAAIVGITFAQYVGSQTNGTNINQTTQGTNGIAGTTYPYPQGYNPYGPTQSGYPFGSGRGMGMCSCFW